MQGASPAIRVPGFLSLALLPCLLLPCLLLLLLLLLRARCRDPIPRAHLLLGCLDVLESCLRCTPLPRRPGYGLLAINTPCAASGRATRGSQQSQGLSCTVREHLPPHVPHRESGKASTHARTQSSTQSHGAGTPPPAPTR
eukprot:SAG25_NODE_642_length_6224_cov_2.486041_5_plen_141_part_00